MKIYFALIPLLIIPLYANANSKLSVTCVDNIPAIIYVNSHPKGECPIVVTVKGNEVYKIKAERKLESGKKLSIDRDIFIGDLVNQSVPLDLESGFTSLEKIRNKYYPLLSTKKKELYLSAFEQYVISVSHEFKSAYYAIPSGETVYKYNCAICHGENAAGTSIAPSLSDSVWIYGGSDNSIHASITNGRQGNMPGHKLSSNDLNELSTAIINGTPDSTPLFTSKGCFACHGNDGKGMTALGSSNLADEIYRFKQDNQLAGIKHTITHGINYPRDTETRLAIMPPWKNILDASQISDVVTYIRSVNAKTQKDKTLKHLDGPYTAEQIYHNQCAMCHATGAAGAPKYKDADEWAPRISQGISQLYENAINGKGAMPVKGLCARCSDDEIKAAVDYMLNF